MRKIKKVATHRFKGNGSKSRRNRQTKGQIYNSARDDCSREEDNANVDKEKRIFSTLLLSLFLRLFPLS